MVGVRSTQAVSEGRSYTVGMSEVRSELGICCHTSEVRLDHLARHQVTCHGDVTRVCVRCAPAVSEGRSCTVGTSMGEVRAELGIGRHTSEVCW